MKNFMQTSGKFQRLFFLSLSLILAVFGAQAQTKKNTKEDKKEKEVATEEVKVKKDSIFMNKTFILDLTDMDAKKDEKNKKSDVLEFKNNKVTSKLFEKEGFLASAYTVTSEANDEGVVIYSFKSESKNAEGFTLILEGAWDGEEITGSASRMKKEKSKGYFEFKGYEKTKKKK
jgi:hypothetical protein